MRSLNNNQEGMGKPLLIVLIIVGVLAIGGIGYIIGTNNAESDLQKLIDEKTAQLQSELDELQDTANEGVEQVQEDIGEGQQTIESLQTENAQLKATIESQNQKIADLEQQLEDLNSTTPPQQ